MTRFIPLLLAAVCIQSAGAQAPRDSARDYTAADVRFMSGMIYHHAQAVMIAITRTCLCLAICMIFIFFRNYVSYSVLQVFVDGS